ncbi:hypothetical protein UlMin_006018 [Ulmus minor]
MSSSSSSPPRSRAANNGDERPRFFDAKAKTKCWAKATIVPGRHPERWRQDAVGNIVYKCFCNCYGCLCFEYDHIVPFSKAISTENRNIHRNFCKIKTLIYLAIPMFSSLVLTAPCKLEGGEGPRTTPSLSRKVKK